MDLGIKGRNALVLGAGGGLGSAICVALAKEGCAVALADRDASALQKAAATLPGGTKNMSIEWDLSNIDAIGGHLKKVESKIGGIDILVNITGGPKPTPVSGVTTADWRANFDMMILSCIAITDQVLEGMKKRNWGRIVTSTSSGVIAPIPNLGQSNALRMALLGWSKTLAREVAANGITSNIIVPGRISTDRIRFLDEAKAKREGRPMEDVTHESTSSIPVGRYGTPEEYADVVTFLASKSASYITGSVIRVDGGLVASI
ncbi:MAG: SDR family oxidoreductase [Xanthobacteraceae bacterium]|nr:SDR family oxidoreductase [Xanthobacteraceae bacterium]